METSSWSVERPREYAIPAVVGAQNATVRITDGALVEVDGAAGTVRLL